MKKRNDIIRKMQKGGVLLEAMAVLGLMTVATPLVYKKAIEKSKEIEDITVASQMRTVRDAAASYVEKNYETVHDGDAITLTQLNQYLPPNFINNLSKSLVPDGIAPDDAMTIVIKKDSHLVGANALPVKRASAYVITRNPVGSGSVDEKRGNRIASLIGSEGGYVVEGGTIYGSNHAWEKDSDSIQPKGGKVDLQEGQIVAATTFTKDPLSGDFLYRNQVEGFPQFNMMMTNLDINGNSIEQIRSLGFKYNWDDKNNSIEFNGETGELIGKNATDKAKETVRMKTHDKNAAGSLELKSGSTDGCSRATADYDGTGSGGLSGCNSAGDETVAMTASYNYAGKKPGDAGYDVNAEIKSGRLAVRSAKDAGTGNQSEAVAYGGYATPEHNTPDTLGGAYELKDANETTRTLIIGQEDESLTVAKKDGSTYEYGMGFLNKTNASKLQMYDSAGGLKTYVGAVEGGAHFMVGDKGSDNKGHLGKMTDQTVFGDAETASITAKKNTYGYARMTARYDRGGYRSGAAIVTNNSDASKFDLEEEKITAVLAENNNSGYLRLSSNNYDGERVWLQAAKNGDGQGNVYLTTGPYSNNYVNMEADRDSGNGYMQFNSGNGSSEIYSKDPSKFSSAYIGRAGTGDESDKVRLLSNGDGETSNSGGHLTLDKGKVIFAANDKSDFTKDGDKFGPVMNLRTGTDSSSGKVAIAAVGNEDQPTAFATTGTSYAAAHAKYTKTEFSNASKAAAVLVSPNGSQNTIAAYADASGKYGDSGTVSVYDPDINAGINFHGHLNSGKSSKTTLYDKNNALAGGGVAVAMKGGQTGTAWLIGQSSNNGGMLQVSTGENNSTNGRVDMYAAGGKGVDMGGTAHMIGGTEHAAIYADYASDGYETSASGMKGHAGNFSNRDVYGKNGTVDGYAMIDIAGGVTADNLNAMDIYTKGDITFTKGDEKGKLYTNVLCIGTNNNSTRNNAGLIDSFGSASVQEDLPQKIKEGKCIPLLPNAKWKDIIYKAAGDIAPLGSYAFRGHEHGGFAKHGHKHPSLIPIKDVQHEKEGKKVGLAEWHETGVTWASKTNAYLVGTVCTKRTNTTSNDGGGGGQPGHRSGDSATVYTGYSSSYTKYCNSASDGISPTNLCTYKISCDQKYFYSSGWTECEASSWNGTCGDNYDGSSRSCTNGTKPVAATATTAAVAGTNAKCKYHPRKWQNYKCTCTAGRTYTKDTTGHYCCNSGTNLKYIYDGRKSYWSSIGRTDP